MRKTEKSGLLSRVGTILIAFAGLSLVSGALLFMETLDHAASLRRWLIMTGGIAVVMLLLGGILEVSRAIGFDFDTLSKDYNRPKDSFLAAASKRILSLGLKLLVLIVWGYLYLAVHDLPYEQAFQQMTPELLVLACIAIAAIIVDEIRRHLWDRFGPKNKKSKPGHLA